jgi:hypothetical protein
LLLNIAIGGNWGGIEGIDDEIFPQTLEVEYVRVYQKFQQHQINGPSQVDAFEDNITYFIAEFPGAEYQWSFPEGVTVTDGQGTSEVTVTWGEVAGTISAVQTYNSVSYTSTFDVSVISTPGNSLLIRGDENGIGTWKINEGSGNTIEMKYEE